MTIPYCMEIMGVLDPIAHMMKHRLTILESRIAKPLFLVGGSLKGL